MLGSLGPEPVAGRQYHFKAEGAHVAGRGGGALAYLCHANSQANIAPAYPSLSLESLSSKSHQRTF